jgi:hypothetical protein
VGVTRDAHSSQYNIDPPPHPPPQGGREPALRAHLTMSPELAFILSLALRMAVAAAFVVSASMITERSGPAIGALVATLPVSAGPAYVSLALDHDDAFIAQSALASLPMNASTILMSLVYVHLAQRRGLIVSLGAGFSVWLLFALLVRSFEWTLLGGVVVNVLALAICLPLVQRYRTARMPLVTSRWYDIPLRAALVATLVAVIVTLSNVLGPRASGVVALFPAVFTSLILVLMPRIGGRATAALLANSQWGMVGFGIAVLLLHLTALPLGRWGGLSAALAMCVAWNFGLWLYGRRQMRLRASSPP